MRWLYELLGRFRRWLTHLGRRTPAPTPQPIAVARFRRVAVALDRGVVDHWSGFLPRAADRRCELITRSLNVPIRGYQPAKLAAEYTHEIWIWSVRGTGERELIFRGQFDFGSHHLARYATDRRRWADPDGYRAAIARCDGCAKIVTSLLADRLKTLPLAKLQRYSGSDLFWAAEVAAAILACPYRKTNRLWSDDPQATQPLSEWLVTGQLLDGPFPGAMRLPPEM